MEYLQSNWLIDVAMPKLKPNTFKLVSVIARHTWGWHKDCADFSLSKLMELTGIKNKNTMLGAINEAIDFGYIGRKKWANTHRYCMTVDPKKGQEKQASGTEIVPHYDNQNGTETVPSGTEIVPPARKAVQKSYQNGTETVPPSLYIKKERNIYTPAQDKIQEIITAISDVVKTRCGVGVNEFEFEDAAYAMIGWDATIQDIKDFGEWWKRNGYYPGLPALKSLLEEFRNFKAGSSAKNGASQNAHVDFWQQVADAAATGRFANVPEPLKPLLKGNQIWNLAKGDSFSQNQGKKIFLAKLEASNVV